MEEFRGSALTSEECTQLMDCVIKQLVFKDFGREVKSMERGTEQSINSKFFVLINILCKDHRDVD